MFQPSAYVPSPPLPRVQIIHRDLKAENVLLAPADDGTLNARLADFGLHALVPQPGMASSQWGLCELK